MNAIFHKLALAGDVWVLGLLVAASVLSIGVILERLWVYHRARLDFPAFFDRLTAALEGGNLAEARRIVEGQGSVEGRVAAAGLKNIYKGSTSVEQAMTSRLVLERNRLEANLIVLGTLGNNAPFLGLFGTVLGIIKAFNDLAATGSSGAGVVMAGISSALIATAFGILVAIPAVVANNAFQRSLKNKLANAQSLIHLLQLYLKDEGGGQLRKALKAELEEGVMI